MKRRLNALTLLTRMLIIFDFLFEIIFCNVRSVYRHSQYFIVSGKIVLIYHNNKIQSFGFIGCSYLIEI